MKAVVAMLLGAMTFAAHAGNHDDEDGPGNGSNHHNNTAVATSQAAAVVGGDTNSVSVSETKTEIEANNIKFRSAPDVSAPSINPTSPCALSFSAGVSIMGGGLAGGRSHSDADCNYRETARIFHEMGYAGAALEVLCASEYAKTATVCERVAPVAVQPKQEKHVMVDGRKTNVRLK